MITNLDPAAELFLANVERIQRRLADANRQVSSGKKVLEPADAPDQIDGILQLRADRERNTQIRANLSLALTDAQSADGALTAAIKLMDRARVLAGQGASSTVDEAGRQSLADEVQSLFDQMVAYSQTAVQDRYLFSGDDESTPAYRLDPTSPTGVLRLSTAPATRHIEDPAGGAFVAGRTAQEIFDHRNPDDTPASDNVFGALSGLRAALLANDGPAAAAAVDAVRSSAARLNSMQAFYGGVQSRIQDAMAYAERYDTEIRKQLGLAEDADVVAAALEATQGKTQLEAAFQMRAMMPRSTLFEFIA